MRWQHLPHQQGRRFDLGMTQGCGIGTAKHAIDMKVEALESMSRFGLWAPWNIVGLGMVWVQSQHVSGLVRQNQQIHGYIVLANGYGCSRQTEKLYFDIYRGVRRRRRPPTGHMGNDSPETQLPARYCLHKAFLMAKGWKVDILGSLVFRNGILEGVGVLPRHWNGDCAPVNGYLGLGFNDLSPCS
ncbi:hypothetical protein F0562_036231 [Nyssa sinensis]|uniref:Uncharacterized protein n=1 Tax=Nyssa sinensis TaxID=561372 RepID=A0A5J5AGK5_9ASTE|nr:hypothetical protein F0562_036231 [Nyssa sinensis]